MTYFKSIKSLKSKSSQGSTKSGRVGAYGLNGGSFSRTPAIPTFVSLCWLWRRGHNTHVKSTDTFLLNLGMVQETSLHDSWYSCPYLRSNIYLSHWFYYGKINCCPYGHCNIDRPPSVLPYWLFKGKGFAFRSIDGFATFDWLPRCT